MSLVPPVVSTMGRYSIGPELNASFSSQPNSVGWPAARRVIYVPVYLPIAMTITKFWWVNGGVVAGTVDMGIYSSSGDLPASLLASTGATAPTPINALQAVSASAALTAGTYFLAAMATNASFGMFRSGQGTFTLYHQALGMAMETMGVGVTTLPSTATPVVLGTQNYIPVMGFATVSVI